MRGQLVAALLLTFSAWGCSEGQSLTPIAQKALWSLNGIAFTERSADGTDSRTCRVLVEGHDGDIRVSWLLPPGAEREPPTTSIPAITELAPVHTDGDVADLYRRITGKQHPTLKGELSARYKAFLEGKGR